MRTPQPQTFSWLIAVSLAATLGASCTGKFKRPVTDYKVKTSPEIVERGRYIVNQTAGCPACHTPYVDGKMWNGQRTDMYLAGGVWFDDEDMGMKVVSPNITQDVETGIGGWSDDEIRRAIRDGVRKDGELLMPPMGFASYQYMADEDVDAVVAYLRTVPPIKNQVDRSGNDFGFGISMAKRMGFIHHTPVHDVKAPPKTDKVAYGRYVAIGLSVCSDCHSLTDKGPNNEKNLFGGSQVPLNEKGYGKVWARNLTSDPETGLGKYSADQIKASLKNGVRLDGKPMIPPMALVIPYTSGMSDDDLDALVTFIKSLPPIKHKVPDEQGEGEGKSVMEQIRKTPPAQPAAP